MSPKGKPQVAGGDGSPSAHPADRTLRVLVLAASLREDSLNRRLASLAAKVAERYGATVDLALLRDFEVPLYDGDAEVANGIPAGAEELKRRLSETDAFILSSPEYNGSMPGTIKNLIDWTSRFRPQPFDGRHGLLLSASPSMAGGNRGLWALRIPLEHLGARVFPDMFSLAMAHKAFAAGEIADSALQERFERTVEAFLSLAEAAKHYPCMKRAWVEFLGEPPGVGSDSGRPRPRRRNSRRADAMTYESDLHSAIARWEGEGGRVPGEAGRTTPSDRGTTRDPSGRGPSRDETMWLPVRPLSSAVQTGPRT